jgi:hypothetical protein
VKALFAVWFQGRLGFGAGITERGSALEWLW